MSPRRKLMLFPIAGLIGAMLWTSLGSFTSTASGQTPQVFIARAHKGERAPNFGKAVFILMLGGDARRGNDPTQRFDSIHIVALAPDPNTPGSVRGSILGIPRDTYVDIPGHGKHKINDAGPSGGVDLMVTTVENLTGCAFDYYMFTGFDGFAGKSAHPNTPIRNVAPGLIDAIGGVDFVVPKGGLHDNYAHADFDPGKHHFDGSRALMWSRARHSAQRPRGDFDRQVAQGQLMIAILTEMRRDYKEDPGTALRNLAAARKYTKMNIPLVEALKLGLTALKVRPSTIENEVMDGGTATVSGAGSIVTVGSGAGDQFVDICGDGILTKH